MTQERAAAGAADGRGGQFLPSTSGETLPEAVYLGDDEGSFDFPPTFRNYEDLKDFYRHASISESSLESFDGAIRDHFDAVGVQRREQWLANNPKPIPAAQHATWEADRDAAFADIRATAVRLDPPKIKALCRIRRMAVAAEMLPEQEKARFWSDRFSVPAPGGQVETGSAYEFWQGYHLAEADPDNYRRAQNKKISQLVDEIRGLRGQAWQANNGFKNM